MVCETSKVAETQWQVTADNWRSAKRKVNLKQKLNNYEKIFD